MILTMEESSSANHRESEPFSGPYGLVYRTQFAVGIYNQLTSIPNEKHLDEIFDAEVLDEATDTRREKALQDFSGAIWKLLSDPTF